MMVMTKDIYACVGFHFACSVRHYRILHTALFQSGYMVAKQERPFTTDAFMLLVKTDGVIFAQRDMLYISSGPYWDATRMKLPRSQPP